METVEAFFNMCQIKQSIARIGLFLIILLGVAGLSAAQTPSPTPIPQTVVVSQSFVDDATKAFKELKATEAALDDALAKIVAGDATKAALENALALTQKVVDGYKGLQFLEERKNELYEQMLGLYDRMNKVLTQMLDRAVAQINKPKSGFDKVLDGIKSLVKFIAGVAVGKVLGGH